MPSQLATQVDAKPSIVTKPKFRYKNINICTIVNSENVSYSQNLLLSQNRHVMLVGVRSSVLLRDMTDAIIKDFF